MYGVQRWAGYSQPVRVARGRYTGDLKQMGEEDLKVTDKHHEERVGEVVRNGRAPNMWGVKGSCIISDMLPYLIPRRTFFVPINHALHRGVVRDLFLQLLQTPSELNKQLQSAPAEGNGAEVPPTPAVMPHEFIFDAAERREMAARGDHLTCTTEFGRTYKVIRVP